MASGYDDYDSESSKIFDCHNESWDRNDVLNFYHQKIPSYALWDEIYVSMESIETRIKWWEKYQSVDEKHISDLAKLWIDVLNSKKASIES